jgi:hypothetical protein
MGLRLGGGFQNMAPIVKMQGVTNHDEIVIRRGNLEINTKMTMIIIDRHVDRREVINLTVHDAE